MRFLQSLKVGGLEIIQFILSSIYPLSPPLHCRPSFDSFFYIQIFIKYRGFLPHLTRIYLMQEQQANQATKKATTDKQASDNNECLIILSESI